MPLEGFEPAISAGERPQTLRTPQASTGITSKCGCYTQFAKFTSHTSACNQRPLACYQQSTATAGHETLLLSCDLALRRYDTFYALDWAIGSCEFRVFAAVWMRVPFCDDVLRLMKKRIVPCLETLD